MHDLFKRDSSGLSFPLSRLCRLRSMPVMCVFLLPWLWNGSFQTFLLHGQPPSLTLLLPLDTKRLVHVDSIIWNTQFCFRVFLCYLVSNSFNFRCVETVYMDTLSLCCFFCSSRQYLQFSIPWPVFPLEGHIWTVRSIYSRKYTTVMENVDHTVRIWINISETYQKNKSKNPSKHRYFPNGQLYNFHELMIPSLAKSTN